MRGVTPARRDAGGADENDPVPGGFVAAKLRGLMAPVVGVPPCCAGCTAYDREDRVCLLLTDPTLDNRRRLLTMPCDVQRLLQARFRAYEGDVAQEALLSWLAPDWDVEDILLSYGRAPRDARLWLGSWPYLYLGRNAIRSLHRAEGRVASLPPTELAEPKTSDPALALRMTRALERLRRIDPVGMAMLLDFLQDRFDAGVWAGSLACSPASVTDRKYLAIYRYAVFFHGITEQISPPEAAVALQARRFAPGDPGEHEALDATRTALQAPDLSLMRWRQLYREGAARSLALLASPEALGPETMAGLSAAFRRVLRVDVDTDRL